MGIDTIPPSPDHDQYYDHGEDEDHHTDTTGVTGTLADVFSTAAFGELESLRSHLSSLMLTSHSSLATLINTADPYGMTLLHTAAREGHAHVVTYLKQHGAMDIADPSGCTALHAAAGAGHVDVVKQLLSHGNNEQEKKIMVNTRDNQGRTPLHWSTRNDHDAVAHILIAAGADVGMTDGKGEGALGWMSRYRSRDFRETDPPPSIPADAAPFPAPPSTTSTSQQEEEEMNAEAYRQMREAISTYAQIIPIPGQQTQTTTQTRPSQPLQPSQPSQTTIATSNPVPTTSTSSSKPPRSSRPPHHVTFAATSSSSNTHMHESYDETMEPSTSTSIHDDDEDATMILTTPENYNPYGTRRSIRRHVVYTQEMAEEVLGNVEPMALPPVDYR